METGNPIIRHRYTADPTALAVGDTLWLYTGHDEAPVGTCDYAMHDWRCFSSKDLRHWTEHPVPLKATDFGWSAGGAFATKIFPYRGRFYWFVSTRHKDGTAIGLAVSERPEGPFRDAIGKPLVTLDMLPAARNEKANLDPTVLLDPNGRPWLYWGNGLCYFARLTADLSAVEGDIRTVALPGFEEGSHLHERNGRYYLSYGYGMPEKIAYAMSGGIEGPWIFQGILNEVAGNCETNRPCILDFNGHHCFFYHNGALKGGGSHRRSVCLDALHYNDDGTMRRVVMTSEGMRL